MVSALAVGTSISLGTCWFQSSVKASLLPPRTEVGEYPSCWCFCVFRHMFFTHLLLFSLLIKLQHWGGLLSFRDVDFDSGGTFSFTSPLLQLLSVHSPIPRWNCQCTSLDCLDEIFIRDGSMALFALISKCNLLTTRIRCHCVRKVSTLRQSTNFEMEMNELYHPHSGCGWLISTPSLVTLHPRVLCLYRKSATSLMWVLELECLE